MEDQVRQTNSGSHSSEPADQERNEPVRSRWTPKPEQILILESIFNSGMVNPPKEETIKIRKLLEKFGSVGDANVFYWFQNRRSRSRRRQRQIQAATLNASSTPAVDANNILPYNDQYTTTMGGFVPSPTTTTSSFFPSQSSPSNCLVGSSSSSCSFPRRVGDHLQSLTGALVGVPEEFEQTTSINSIFHPLDTSNLHYQSGVITVFINGVPTEVQRGPLDIKGMFGQDLVLVHSSGVGVPFNDHGFSVQGLQHGECYFLVSRPI